MVIDHLPFQKKTALLEERYALGTLCLRAKKLLINTR
jgi:hypothetical protein